MDENTLFSGYIAGGATTGMVLGNLAGLFSINSFGVIVGAAATFLLAYLIGEATEAER